MSSSDDLVLDSGDNAWMMTSTALVLMMTPALAFFYGGLVNRKNVLNQLFLSIVCMGIVFVQWVLFGFSFVFGPPVSSGFGSFGDGALRFGERLDAINSPTYPLLTYAAYQATFAIITAAIISGAIVGRMKLIPYMIFIFVWTTVCYDPLAHWVFSANGWLKTLGALDFAGGTVVHISSGTSGLVASMILGRRIDYKHHKAGAHNLPFTVLGCSLLWVGWIGFNAGSANAANGIASLALVNTIAAAAAGLLTWVVLDAIRGHVTISGTCSAPIIGLVGVTPAAGFVQPGWALLFGVIPVLIIYFIILFKDRLRLDDTLDVFYIHGVGGIIGAFMTGLFAQKSYNPGGADGAFYGHPVQLWYQIAGILTTIGFCGACTALILLILKYTIGIRLTVEQELRGLDVIAHGERWGIADQPKNRRTTTTITSSRSDPPPYSNGKKVLSNRSSFGNRSKSRRIRQVRVRPDIWKRRSSSVRSETQSEGTNRQPKTTDPVMKV